jgi:hypothetical protein
MEETSIAGSVDWNSGLRLRYSDCIGTGTDSITDTTHSLVVVDALNPFGSICSTWISPNNSLLYVCVCLRLRAQSL